MTAFAGRLAVLIPARDESAVIEGLLASLAWQTVGLAMRDVYVIVEDAADETVKIAKHYGVSVVVRRHLAGRRRKGYALDEAVKQILAAGEHYAAYFVFDADNVLPADYCERLLKHFAHYDLATGRRQIKNIRPNVVEVMSMSSFTIVNALGNRRRMRQGRGVIFSGTGFWVRGTLVEEWQGWPFHGLTEDYEMSLYAIVHGYKSYYDETCVFRDEQPTRLGLTIQQRVRWVRGYFDARRTQLSPVKHSKQKTIRRELRGVKPLIAGIILAVVLLIAGITWLSIGQSSVAVVALFSFIGLLYLALVVLTLVLMYHDKMKLGFWLRLKVILLNPFYLLLYVPCALWAVLAKEVRWDKIPHGQHK